MTVALVYALAIALTLGGLVALVLDLIKSRMP